MRFTNPSFLYALFALAIPVLIHLFNFRKYKKVYFSNVSFLETLKIQNSSKNKLKNLLVLVSRCLALLFLVLAFAGPYISDKSISVNDDQLISVYIDNSYSMGALNNEGTLLDEAKRKAKELVKNFNVNDRFQLLTNDFDGKQQRFIRADEFIKQLDDIKINDIHRNMNQVLQRQQSLFNEGKVKRIYQISDFQKSFVGQDKINIDTLVKLSLLKLNAQSQPNISIDSMWFASPVHTLIQNEKLIVRLKNYGDKAVDNVSLKLLINGQQKGIINAKIPQKGTSIDTLSYSNINSGWQKGELKINDFPITFDDNLYFTYKVNNSQKVLLISGKEATSTLEKLYKTDSYFNVTSMADENINYALFPTFDLIILNEITQFSSGLSQELKRFLSNNGSLAIFPNTASAISDYSSFLKSLSLPNAKELIQEKTQVIKVNWNNILLKNVFDKTPVNVELPTAYKYFDYENNIEISNETIFQLPLNRSLLSSYSENNSTIFLSSTGLKPEDSNLTSSAFLLPLMYNLAFESNYNLPYFFVISNDNNIAIRSNHLAPEQHISLVGNGFPILPEIRNINGKLNLFIADQVKESGFYQLKNSDSIQAIVAFNNNRMESDLQCANQGDLNNILGENTYQFIDFDNQNNKSIKALKNNATELWKLCLILSLIFLLIEILLLRYFKTFNNFNKHEPFNQGN